MPSGGPWFWDFYLKRGMQGRWNTSSPRDKQESERILRKSIHCTTQKVFTDDILAELRMDLPKKIVSNLVTFFVWYMGQNGGDKEIWVLIWQHGKQSATITTFYKNLPMYTVIQQLILEIFKKWKKVTRRKCQQLYNNQAWWLTRISMLRTNGGGQQLCFLPLVKGDFSDMASPFDATDQL